MFASLLQLTRQPSVVFKAAAAAAAVDSIVVGGASGGGAGGGTHRDNKTCYRPERACTRLGEINFQFTFSLFSSVSSAYKSRLCCL